MSPAKNVFEKVSRLPVDRRAAFAWHERPGAFERLTPPWEHARIIADSGSLRTGESALLEVSTFGVPVRWQVAYDGYVEFERFADVQVRGPFRSWRHEHIFEDADAGRGLGAGGDSLMHERIQYELPFAPLSRAVAGGFVQRKLERLFRYRHEVLTCDLASHARSPLVGKRILVTGASGFIGRSLVGFLTTGGCQVTRLVRKASTQKRADRTSEVLWDPASGTFSSKNALEGFDAVIHLAGENVGEGRWTPERKAMLLKSRTDPTLALARALASLERPPQVFLSASGIGYYGSRGDESLDENATKGTGFLSDVAAAWEGATRPAADAGVRTVQLRMGVVLGAGGALEQMVVPFRAGLGAPLGSGNQWTSWIGLQDVLGVIAFVLVHDDFVGPVNAVAPTPIRNADFSRMLATTLNRPFVAPAVPAGALSLAFGSEKAADILLASQKAVPGKLETAGYVFMHKELRRALAHALGRP